MSGNETTSKKKKKGKEAAAPKKGMVVTDLDSGIKTHVRDEEAMAEAVQRRGSVMTRSAFPDYVLEGEYTDDPQWPLFLDHHRALVEQLDEENEAGVDGYEVNAAEADTSRSGTSLMSLLSSAVGEMTSITIPIGYVEPSSFLQRLAEKFQYAFLLDRAAAEHDELMRLTLVAAWVVAAHSFNIRTYKPFNPLLGETFEFQCDGRVDGMADGEEVSYKFLAEQVSHHPPVAATHCYNEHWEVFDVKGFTSRFGGNSLTVKPSGVFHVRFPAHDEEITFDPIYACAHNIIVGSVWIEQYGETVIRNHRSGAKCVLNFEKAGWLGKSRNKVNAKVYDADGKEAAKYAFSGKWDESIALADGTKLWERTGEMMDDNKYGYTVFADYLNRISDARFVPATDSRLRADRMLLAQAKAKEAGTAKSRLENLQRAAKKERERLGLQWMPRFFAKRADLPKLDGVEDDEWGAYRMIADKYWEQHAERLRRCRAKMTASNATIVEEKAPSGTGNGSDAAQASTDGGEAADDDAGAAEQKGSKTKKRRNTKGNK